MYALLFFTFSCLNAGGGASDVRHFPLWQSKAPLEKTRIIVSFWAPPNDGIDSISLFVTNGKMTSCAEWGGDGSIVPCRRDACLSELTWKLVQPRAAKAVTHEFDFDDGSLVTYWATATTVSGCVLSSEEISFAVGSPPSSVLLTPVWWHRAERSTSKIDLAFLPDSHDYGQNYHKQFGKDLAEILEGSFFNQFDRFASTYFAGRHYFNLWAGPLGADAGAKGAFTHTPALASLFTSMDGRIIVRRDKVKDWGKIGLGGDASIRGNDGYSEWNLVHETGHFILGQADEYTCGKWDPVDDCRNVFGSKKECEIFGSCAEIEIGCGRYYIVDANYKIMAVSAPNVSSEWGRRTEQCIERRFKRCGAGACF